MHLESQSSGGLSQDCDELKASLGSIVIRNQPIGLVFNPVSLNDNRISIFCWKAWASSVFSEQSCTNHLHSPFSITVAQTSGHQKLWGEAFILAYNPTGCDVHSCEEGHQQKLRPAWQSRSRLIMSSAHRKQRKRERRSGTRRQKLRCHHQ